MMEELYTYIKELFFVDNENIEIRDISKGVDIILHRYGDFIAKETTDLKIDRLQSSGSMTEQTRIWERLSETSRHPDLEFDYLTVVQRPNPDIRFERSCLGHMRVMCDTDVDTLQKNFIDLNDIVKTFWNAFVTVVKNQCSCFEKCEERVMPFTFTITVLRNKHGCDKCSTTMGSGKLRLSYVRPDISAHHIHPIQFEWASERKLCFAPKKCQDFKIQKHLLDTLIIHADFLPAFEIDVQNTTGNHILGNKSQHHCFLVPKHCKQHDECWRISYCLSEMEILQNTTQNHRDVYKLLKVFQSLFKSGLKSYHIKTALLHHISACRNVKEGRHGCLQETLDFLVKGMMNRSMPHTIEGLNLRDVFSEHSLYLYQAQLFYAVLNNALGSDEERNKNMNRREIRVILDAFVLENGEDLFNLGRYVMDGEAKYAELLTEIMKLGEWVSRKRVNEYRDFHIKEDTCVIL